MIPTAAEVEGTRLAAECQRELAWLAVDAERVRVYGDVLIRCDAMRGLSAAQRLVVLSALLPPSMSTPSSSPDARCPDVKRETPAAIDVDAPSPARARARYAWQGAA